MIPLLLSIVAVSGIGMARPAPSFRQEAARLTSAMISRFYDAKNRIWKPPIQSAEAVGDQGYTFWPSLLAWQAIIEAAKVDPKRWMPDVGRFYDVLEQYFDAKGHAYCAWRYFPGNDDHFYDDNTWAAVACMEAYELTHSRRYRLRAVDIFDGFVKGGWDASDHPGGLRWGTKAGLVDRQDRTVSATAAGALAALLIAKVQDTKANQAWAKQALDWIHDKLSATNGLIFDGFSSPDFKRMPNIWTYNTGVPIRAALEYARQTKDQHYRHWAVAMGKACLDRTQSPMFDGATKTLAKRYWWDSTFFIQYLVDGLRRLSIDTGDRSYVKECRREAAYVNGYLRDKDGLYWRNMRLWTIDADRYAAYKELTGQATPAPAYDGSERSMASGDLAKPTADRPMVKTLLANAGVCRMLWLLSH